MAKGLAVVGAVAAVVALALSTVVQAAADDDQHRTVRVRSVNVEEKFLDLNGRGPSLGDDFVFSSNLWRNGQRVGRAGVSCTVTSLRHQEFQCLGTVRLGNGQITIQGLLADEPELFAFPVTGGSGAYTGADGVLHVRQVSERTEILTFDLEL